MTRKNSFECPMLMVENSNKFLIGDFQTGQVIEISETAAHIVSFFIVFIYSSFPFKFVGGKGRGGKSGQQQQYGNYYGNQGQYGMYFNSSWGILLCHYFVTLPF